MKARGWLYRMARILGDTGAVTSGDPKKMARRAKNKGVGRLLGSFWRRLWK
jgi:hypothetical protein